MRKVLLIVPRSEKSDMDELLALLDTAGYDPVHIVPIRSEKHLSRSKLNEIEYLIEEADVNRIVFYGDPKPSIVSRIMKATGKEVIDRTLLILEIFKMHAGSKEAKMQIELARLKHIIPLIRELVRRKRMGEMPGFMGLGMYDVEKYYRHIKARITRLRRELVRIRNRREIMRRNRRGIPSVAIVGYASAGKTSLFNKLTGESKPVGEEYFTTLQTKHKSVTFKSRKIVFIDTVGFIKNIPPEIIEAFHATLEETASSDLIIFVLDVSEPFEKVIQKLEAGLSVLSRIDADTIPLIIALNKIDRAKPSNIHRVKEELNSIIYQETYNIVEVIEISALTGWNLDHLMNIVNTEISKDESVLGEEVIAYRL
jgi:GTP-binding protein HflX